MTNTCENCQKLLQGADLAATSKFAPSTRNRKRIGNTDYKTFAEFKSKEVVGANPKTSSNPMTRKNAAASPSVGMTSSAVLKDRKQPRSNYGSS